MGEETCSAASGESSSIYCEILLTNESKVKELTGKSSTKEGNSKRLLLLAQLPWIERTVRWIFTGAGGGNLKYLALKLAVNPRRSLPSFPKPHAPRG